MRVIEAHEIGYDPDLRPTTDVGTVSIIIEGRARPQDDPGVPKGQLNPSNAPSVAQDAPRRSAKGTILIY